MSQRISPEEHIRRIESALSVSVLGFPKNGRDKVALRCLVCGFLWSAAPSNIVRQGKAHFGCPECGRKRQGKDQILKNEILKRFDSAGLLVDLLTFCGVRQKATLRCSVCGSVWKQSPAHMVSATGRLKTGCPDCAAVSKGEEKVALFLHSRGIDFERQKRFGNCLDRRCLPFDFYIPKERLLIEYQGLLHFVPSRFKNGQRKLEKTRQHDRIKREWAMSNGYNFVEILYTDNVGRVLNSIFPQRG